MKSNLKKKGLLTLVGLSVLGGASFLVNKNLDENVTEKKVESQKNSSAKIASLDCSEQKQSNLQEIKENKNEYLFIGCNGFY